MLQTPPFLTQEIFCGVAWSLSLVLLLFPAVFFKNLIKLINLFFNYGIHSILFCITFKSGYVDGRDLVLLTEAHKERQISKSISMQSEFISDPFPWKRTGLAKVGA